MVQHQQASFPVLFDVCLACLLLSRLGSWPLFCVSPSRPVFHSVGAFCLLCPLFSTSGCREGFVLQGCACATDLATHSPNLYFLAGCVFGAVEQIEGFMLMIQPNGLVLWWFIANTPFGCFISHFAGPVAFHFGSGSLLVHSKNSAM